MALSLFLMPLQVFSLSQKLYGDKQTAMEFHGLRSSTKWTESAPTISCAINSMKEKLGANAIAVQCPIGAESEFKGMVDLVTMKAYLFLDETLGAKYEDAEIPADLLNNAKKCAQNCSKSSPLSMRANETFMMKVLENPESLTEEEIHAVDPQRV